MCRREMSILSCCPARDRNCAAVKLSSTHVRLWNSAVPKPESAATVLTPASEDGKIRRAAPAGGAPATKRPGLFNREWTRVDANIDSRHALRVGAARALGRPLPDGVRVHWRGPRKARPVWISSVQPSRIPAREPPQRADDPAVARGSGVTLCSWRCSRFVVRCSTRRST